MFPPSPSIQLDGVVSFFLEDWSSPSKRRQLCRKLLHRVSRWPKKEVAKAMMCNTAHSRAALCFSWLISQLRSSSGSIHWIWAKYRGTERSGTGKRQFHSNIPGLFSPLISEGAALRKPDAFFGKSQLGANLSRADFKFLLLSPPAAWGMKVPEGTLTQIKAAFCFPASF